MNPESKRPIAIEDLLRLKCAERPPAEFWTEFDRQLRAKQLAALVAKRPWWQSAPRFFAGFSRYHVPLGATAILAVTFISVRYYQSAPPRVENIAHLSTQGAAVAVLSPSSGLNQSDLLPGGIELSVVERSGTEVASIGENSAATTPLDSASSGAREHSAVIPLLGSGAGLAAVSAGEAPRYVGSSLAIAQNDAPAVTRGLLGPSRGFESRALPARVAVEPLQQITPPSERSRAKLLTAMLSMSSPEAPARPADRAASKLSEERLYDQIHRFGARGPGVTMKF